MFRYYGFESARRNPADVLDAEDRKQHLGLFAVGAGLRNARPNALGIDYHARLAADFLEDNFASRERHTRLAGGGRRDFGDAWYAELDLDLDFVDFNALGKQDLKVYQLRPVVGAHFDRVGLRLGMVVSNENDVFAFYPRVEGSYAINPGLVVVAGADGGPRQQSFRQLTRYLPFLVSAPEIRIAQEWRGFAGVQGKARGIDFEVTASYTRVNNLALFVSDTREVYKFRPRYDSAAIVGLRLEASAPLAARLSGGLQVENRVYALETADDPYLLPSFDAQLSARYEVIEARLSVTGLVVAQNALPYLRPADLTETPQTGTLLDLSVHGEYEFGGRFGAFVQANNLLDNQRRKFPYYPMLGINLLAGLTARF